MAEAVSHNQIPIQPARAGFNTGTYRVSGYGGYTFCGESLFFFSKQKLYVIHKLGNEQSLFAEFPEKVAPGTFSCSQSGSIFSVYSIDFGKLFVLIDGRMSIFRNPVPDKIQRVPENLLRRGVSPDGTSVAVLGRVERISGPEVGDRLRFVETPTFPSAWKGGSPAYREGNHLNGLSQAIGVDPVIDPEALDISLCEDVVISHHFNPKTGDESKFMTIERPDRGRRQILRKMEQKSEFADPGNMCYFFDMKDIGYSVPRYLYKYTGGRIYRIDIQPLHLSTAISVSPSGCRIASTKSDELLEKGGSEANLALVELKSEELGCK